MLYANKHKAFPIKNTTRWHGIKVKSYYTLEKFSF